MMQFRHRNVGKPGDTKSTAPHSSAKPATATTATTIVTTSDTKSAQPISRATYTPEYWKLVNQQYKSVRGEKYSAAVIEFRNSVCKQFRQYLDTQQLGEDQVQYDYLSQLINDRLYIFFESPHGMIWTSRSGDNNEWRELLARRETLRNKLGITIYAQELNDGIACFHRKEYSSAETQFITATNDPDTDIRIRAYLWLLTLHQSNLDNMKVAWEWLDKLEAYLFNDDGHYVIDAIVQYPELFSAFHKNYIYVYEHEHEHEYEGDEPVSETVGRARYIGQEVAKRQLTESFDENDDYHVRAFAARCKKLTADSKDPTNKQMLLEHLTMGLTWMPIVKTNGPKVYVEIKSAITNLIPHINSSFFEKQSDDQSHKLTIYFRYKYLFAALEELLPLEKDMVKTIVTHLSTQANGKTNLHENFIKTLREIEKTISRAETTNAADAKKDKASVSAWQNVKGTVATSASTPASASASTPAATAATTATTATTPNAAKAAEQYMFSALLM